MTLNKKLSLGLVFLFFIIFTLAIFCSYYIQKLSAESVNILRNNYDSIVYSKKMFLSLDDMETSITRSLFMSDHKGAGHHSHLYESAKTEFERYLKKESNNITEIHERELVDTLNRNYTLFAKLGEQVGSGRGTAALYFGEILPLYEKLRQTINAISDLNMEAIVRKNNITKRDSTNIITSMAVIGSICMIMAFAYIWYFPFYVSNSMSYLADKMKKLLKALGINQEITADDELTVILQSMNLIESCNMEEAEKEKRKPARKKRR